MFGQQETSFPLAEKTEPGTVLDRPSSRECGKAVLGAFNRLWHELE
jgi:hypothetical protein